MKRHLFIIMITLCCGLCICRAQERFDWNVLGVAEGQFRPDNGRFNMFSLLSYSIDVQLWKGADFRFDGMTFAKQHKLNYISDVISTFSQLDAEPSPFRLSILGLGQQIGPVWLFAGIRNTDPDFFDDEALGFFLGSAHGLPPTLSANYDFANYSTSTLMAMAQWQISDMFMLKTAFYKGESVEKPSEQFRFKGGVRNLTSISLETDKRKSTIGMTVGPDFYGGHGMAMYATHTQKIREKTNIFFEASHYFGRKGEPCRNYLGTGAIYTFNEHNLLGGCASLADFSQDHDDSFHLEFNYAHIFGPVMLQPVLSLFWRYGEWQTVAFLRLTIELSSK